jgi:hypothetical protein
MQLSDIWRSMMTMILRTPMIWVILAVNIAAIVSTHFVDDDSTAAAIISISSFAKVAFAMIITRQLLFEDDYIMPVSSETGQRGFFSVFGLSMLSGLGIVLGSLLLIVPGVFLFLRWSIALPIMVAQHTPVVESLKRSWAMTEPVQTAIFMAFLPIILIWITSMAVVVFQDEGPILMASDIANEIVTLFSWVLAVPIYQSLSKKIEDIFA